MKKRHRGSRDFFLLSFCLLYDDDDDDDDAAEASVFTVVLKNKSETSGDHIETWRVVFNCTAVLKDLEIPPA